MDAISRKKLRAVGYIRVSTEEQAELGAGLAAQEGAIRAEASRREWQLLSVEVDRGLSANNLNRPALSRALNAVRSGNADALVVSKLDRLSRSLLDFAQLMESARQEGWSIVCLDLGVDMTSASGELIAGVVASTSQYERRLISQRTREALAVKRSQGVRLGRPRTLADNVIARIVQERQGGKTLQSIADALNDDRVSTAQGGRSWKPGTVAAVLRSQAATALTQD